MKQQSQAHSPINVTFYVQLSAMHSIAGTVNPVAMTIDTHMQNDFHFLKTLFWVDDRGKRQK